MRTYLTRLCVLVVAAQISYPGLLTALARSSQPPQVARRPVTRVAASDRFAFYSDPWVNLHHFLYQWSREDLGLEIGRHPRPMPERSSVNELDATDRRTWLDAVGFYRDVMARRNHFERPMLRLKAMLVGLDGDPTAAPPDVIPGVADALQAAMPIYLKTWWSRHDESNQRWINDLLPLLRRHEAAYVRLTTRVHGSRWPGAPFRVDVTRSEGRSVGK